MILMRSNPMRTGRAGAGASGLRPRLDVLAMGVLAMGVLAALLMLLSACASDRPKPAPLQAYTPGLAVQPLWSAQLGSIDFPLGLAVHKEQVVAAASSGAIVALDANTGFALWRAQADAPLTAGVGSDGRFAAVVTRNNELVVFEGARQLWKQRIPAAVVTPPLVAGERVFVLAVDRSVYALDAQDGRRLWRYQRQGDALTLAQPGVLMAARNQIVVGQGGRMVALDALRGTVNWDVAVGTPRGTNEVERLADLVGPAARRDDRVCVRAFQNAVGCVDLARGALLWSRNGGGTKAVGADAGRVFGGDASDRVTAWSADKGDLAWTNETLLHRGLSGALALGASVVFGDSEGYLHFLSVRDGSLQLRLPTDGKAIVGTPRRVGEVLLVATRGGGLFAFRTP
jgi:outer membrane assembly lipoprotein YfgL